MMKRLGHITPWTRSRQALARLILFVLAGLFVLVPHVYAQTVKVQGSVNDNTVGTEEVVQFTLQIQGASLNDEEQLLRQIQKMDAPPRKVEKDW